MIKTRYWLIVASAIIFSIIIRINFLEIPLERDEGEFAYIAQLMLDGEIPYRSVYSTYLPGVASAYAFFMMIFGQTIGAIRLGLIVFNALTAICIFLLAKKLFNDFVGALAAFSYAILSLNRGVLGHAAHATQFANLAVFSGLLFLASIPKNHKSISYFLSGLLLGLAFIMRRHAVFFLLFGYSYILYVYCREKPFRAPRLFSKWAYFSLGAIMPYAAVTAIVIYHGAFDRFWFWTMEYSRGHISRVSPLGAIHNLKHIFPIVVSKFEPLWALAGAGYVSLLADKVNTDNKVFARLLVFFSFLCVIPGFVFRGHYFILFLPAVCILAGVAFDFVRRHVERRFVISWGGVLLFFIFFSLISLGVIREKEYFFTRKTPAGISRMIYGSNPFPESIEISEFIKSRTGENDTIAVLGSEAQIYFYTKRKAATGYIYAYGLVDGHSYNSAMQREMIGEIEEAEPKFLIFVNVVTSWLPRRKAPADIFHWYSDYTGRHYNLAGVADIISGDKTVYKWGDEARKYKPQSNYSVLIYERK